MAGGSDGLMAASESDAADAGIVRVREAFGVAEALEFGDCFRGALLGHAELLGEVTDCGPGVEEVLEDVTVGHAQVGETHQAVSRFATDEELAAFFDPDAVHTRLPNALCPDGTVRHLPDLIDAAPQGHKLLTEQHFEVINAVAVGGQ
ncbi:hypothetical protein PV726_36930 [Streptomyces europaeiscabiei]|nr:hypothetical protein [Streptomyces europaeiscabiei]MDX3695806.1 hypothetical protein [Streptomyces europaeiscabiei]